MYACTALWVQMDFNYKLHVWTCSVCLFLLPEGSKNGVEKRNTFSNELYCNWKEAQTDQKNEDSTLLSSLVGKVHNKVVL